MSKTESQTKANVKCYASVLGNCSEKQSKEHYASKGLFTSKVVTIAGQKFLNGAHKELPLTSLGLKILCKYHNERLSPLDAEGVKFFQVLDEAQQHSSNLANRSRGDIWRKRVFYVSGKALEQWMAKMAVGVLFEDDGRHWHLNRSSTISPPEEIIKAIYGLTEFKYPMGMYSISARGDINKNEERVNIEILTNSKTKGYMGCMINLRGVHFLMWLSYEDLKGSIFSSPTGAMFGPAYEEPIYHFRDFTYTTKGRLAGVINLDWSEKPLKLLKA